MTHPQTIALIGLGTIGLSFTALHLQSPAITVQVYDIRPDLKSHISSLLPVYLPPSSPSVDELIRMGRLKICDSLRHVCEGADIIQEQGPDVLEFKKSTWRHVVEWASASAHLWSSTSGICASKQAQDLDKDGKSRLLVVHPFNPPHIMPLIEIVPSPETDPSRTEFAATYFKSLNSGHKPVIIKKETQGFVGNRLAFALFREACHLVATDVVSVEDIDTIMESSLGPRWAAAGPFKTYNSAGGAGGIEAFMHHLAGTMQECWDDAGNISLRGTSAMDGNQDDDWTQKVARQTEEAYGRPTAESLATRDRDLKNIVEAQPKHD